MSTVQAADQGTVVEDMEEGSKEVSAQQIPLDLAPQLTNTGQQHCMTPDLMVSTAAERGLVRKMDARIIPLSAGIYLLCYLDRSNVGNARTLNASTHHDLLSETNMTDYQYVISLMIFLVAYGLFEAPSNSTWPLMIFFSLFSISFWRSAHLTRDG